MAAETLETKLEEGNGNVHGDANNGIHSSRNHGGSSNSKSRDMSPKSVISPSFTSQPSSTSGSMEHKAPEKPKIELPLEKKKYPFAQTHEVDPLCRINLRETSEFVKAFPKVDINANPFTEKFGGVEIRHTADLKGYKRRELSGRHSVPPRSLDCPGTPSRLIFGAGENPIHVKYMGGGLTRRHFPSKWDDAEKWLINANSSFANSPSNNNPLGRQSKISPNPNSHLNPNVNPNFNTNYCTSSPVDVYQVRGDLNTGNPASVMNDLHAKEFRHVGNKAGSGDDKVLGAAGIVDRRNEERYLAGALTMGDVSSSVSSSVLSSDLRLSAEHGAFTAFPCNSFMKDKFTDKVEPAPKYRFQEAGAEQHHGKHERHLSMKDASTEVAPAVQHRDMGTEMTPLGSSRTSRCHTPVKNTSPARHNTPSSHSALVNGAGIDIGELEKCHIAKLELQGLQSGVQFSSLDKSVSNWSSREEEEEDVSKSLRHFDFGDCKRGIMEARAAAWEDAERSKAYTRYQREEARIEAWLNLQSAKAESESRKLEVKIEKMRSNLEEKLMKKMAVAHKRVEEWRIAANAQHAEQLLKTAERADRMRKDGNFSFNFSTCSCFSCRP